MTTVEHYDWRSFTYSQALELARISTDAFSDDPLVRVFRPGVARAPLPPIVEYEQLIARAQQFGRAAETEARHLHLRVRSDPRIQVFLLRGGQGYVAGAQWVLPKYLPQPRQPLLHRLKTWVLRGWYAVRDWWDVRRGVAPEDSAALRAELETGERELGVFDTRERVDELFALSPKQLKETAYPRDFTYYLRLLVTRPSEQRKGHGARLAKESLHALRPFQRPPHFVGPPKATVIASAPGRGLYMQLGYSLGAVYEHELPTGEWSPQTYFFLNLRDHV